ncbi:helix-turn-helix domain-containing protein [Amycolatopsis japonica]|uniref:helix-turn-helix domain-containing protein n=1 Tax=Amycolatopsis japonica TaxID=208439 RepID=UPI00366B121D
MRNLDDVTSNKARFYNVKEAAKILRVSKMTIYRAIKEGQFPAISIRGRLTIPAQAIDNMEEAALSPNELDETQEFT